MKKAAIMFALLLLPVVASARSPMPASNCELQERITLDVQFKNNRVKEAELAGFFDTRIAKVKELAKQVGIEDLNVSRQNFNLRGGDARYNEYQEEGVPDDGKSFHFSGSLNVSVENIEKALAFLKILSQNNISANLNYDANRQSCR